MTPEKEGSPDEQTPTSERVYIEAARLFRERGYEAATTRELSRRIGVNKASLYHHMAKKEDLLYRICLTSLEHVRDATAKEVAGYVQADDRLRAMIQSHLDSMLSEIDMHATMLLERSALSPERREEINSMQAAYADWVLEIVREAQINGSLRRDLSAESITQVLFNQLNWTIIWYRPGRSAPAAELATIYTKIFFDGARGPQKLPRLRQAN